MIVADLSDSNRALVIDDDGGGSVALFLVTILASVTYLGITKQDTTETTRH